jgi:hypothetical protein
MADTAPIEQREVQQHEVEQLRGEVAALRQQVGVERAERRARTRGIIGWVLTVLAVLATTLALLAIWVFRTFTVTDLFVARVGPIIEQPEVTQAVGQRAAAEIVDALDLEDRIRARLPDQADVIAGPVTTAAQNYLAQGATKLMQTDQFQQAWDVALTQGHRLSIAILSGQDTDAIDVGDGVVVLNITPLVNALLAEGSDFLSGLLNRDINAPAVTDENVDTAISALESQFGVDLPADFGQITLFQSDDLAAAQQAYQTMKLAVWLAPVFALALIALAVAVSPRRVRTALVIVIGVALMLLLVRLSLDPIEQSVLGAVADDGMRGAVGAAFGTVLQSLIKGISVVLVVGVLAAVALFLVGDSRAARATRSAVRRAPALAAQHRGIALGAGAVVGLLLLAVIPGRSWGQILVVLLLYAALALAVLMAPRPPAEEVAAADEPAGDDATPVAAP